MKELKFGAIDFFAMSDAKELDFLWLEKTENYSPIARDAK